MMRKLLLLFVATTLSAIVKADVLPEFVDMGTSVLWAAEPLGVDEDHPYGNHYRFGAVAPYPETSYFTVYGRTVDEWGGDMSMDAATAVYGKGVSTPSKAQFEELIAACKFSYTYDIKLKRNVLEITSNVTGNTITIRGAGSWVVGNDYTSKGDMYLLTSSGVAGKADYCYYFSPKPASQSLKAILERNAATSFAYQLLPVYQADGVVKATGIELSTSELSMAVGDCVTLQATVLPDDASDKSVVWSTSDESVATVGVAGDVRAISAGECTVTATAGDGSGVSAECAVTVTAATEGMKYVDLGLSVMWGDREIGAEDCMHSGTYYAWGTEANANNPAGANVNDYPIVATTSPFTSVPRDLADETKPYDVAMAVLGNNWHTPDDKEWKELADNCKFSYETADGVSFIRCTSKINGNWIDFKPAGYLKTGSDTPQMSSTVLLQSSEAANASMIYNTRSVNTTVSTVMRYCYWLVPIRPVYGVSESSVDSIIADGVLDGL